MLARAFKVALGLFLSGLTVAAADTAKGPIRFGLTAAVVRENLDLYDRWARYLGRRVGRPVQFEQRRSYREAMELLEVGEHEFAWICSFPFAKYRDSKFLGLLAVPVFEGKPLYRSYIIVPKGSAAQSIMDLERKVFAYSDPDSNSGYIVPRAMLHEMGRNADTFFRHTFFTYSHTETIEAVAQQVAEGAAVDSYVWEYLNKHQPALTAKTRIIQRSRTYGFPPLVYRTNVNSELRQKMTDALMTMDYDPEGRALLAELMLDGFAKMSPDLYDDVHANLDRR